MKKLPLLAAAICLTGCTATVQLPQNVHLTEPDKYGQQRIKEIQFNYPGAPDARGNVAKCVALNVDNKSATLTDSGSYVGAFGRYYAVNTTTTASGGEVTRYVDPANGVVVASGRTNGTQGLLIKNIVDFKMLVDASGDNVLIGFSDITQAQQDTGTLSNPGFTPVGAWAGAGAMTVHDALKAVADNVANCL